MCKYIKNITNSLTNLISELSENPSLFLKNPEKDFTRNRKIDFRLVFTGWYVGDKYCSIFE